MLNLDDALTHARHAALQAWSAISHFHRGSYEIEHKKDGPSTEADKLADTLLAQALERHYPPARFGYLTEEVVRDLTRMDRRHVWIIDPIDGTSDFIRGAGDFALQIGLVEEQDEVWGPVLGVVYHPLAGRLYTAVRERGAAVEIEEGADEPPSHRWWYREASDPSRPPEAARFLPARPLRVSETDDILRMVAVVSASHRTKRLVRVLDAVPFESHYSRGSVGIKLAEIAQRHADVYVNTERGRCKEWDLCGPHIVLEEAGGTVTDLDGRPITYNREEVRLQDGILASNGRVHSQLVERISPLTV